MQLWLIPVFPLLGFLLNGIFGRRFSKAAVNSIAIGSVLLSFAWVLKTLASLGDLNAAHTEQYFTWIQSGILNVGFDFTVDRLTAVMLLVVTGVGSLIHIYSIGYMAHEGGYYRFFCYMNLFMFFMLTLVMAGNLVLMFVGWEGVGLCSYLLIGFYFLRKSAIDAGKKAFITTRIGDVGFTIGILLAFWTFSSVDFGTIFMKVENSPVEAVGQIGVLTTIALLLFAGAIGKSAQLPLYVWLPDAMEGPTPVSALIHAATMVTAGVYMVARMHLLYSHALTAMLVVATVGAVTAFYSATIGLVQTDIKKVLAYSTVSQLGYMFLGLGVGAYAAGIFHLMTHAFFKGLLFLAAGSVIHAMGGEQDMRKMGGLREKIPVTYWTMFAATLAIAGVPLFSGFFSKEAILDAAKDGPHANITLWVLGILGAMLTSFYMFRLLFLTFLGKPRYDEHKVHVHESPKNMLVPLVILAALAVGGGWFALPTMIGGPDHFQNFLRPVFEAAPAGTAAVAEQATETPVTPGAALVKSLLAPGVIVALIGFLTAWWFYIRRPDVPKKLAQSVHGLYTLLLNKYYVDEFYLAVIVRPLLWISTNVLWHVVDENLIDGAVNGAAHSAREIGQQARQLQSGNTRSYAAWVIVGAVCVTVLVLGVWGMVR